jgi:hypothetical protein
MQINMAHINAPAAAGGTIDYAVFDARSKSGTNADNDAVLAQLTNNARLAGLKVDQSALAYSEGGRVRFWGTPTLVRHLAECGLPQWTHTINA